MCNLSTGCLHFSETSLVCRVLERSLAEDTKLGTKRKRSDLWFVDPLNPHERKRLEGWPVGLKNVGNTCWFSAVIQVRMLLFKICDSLNYKFATVEMLSKLWHRFVSFLWKK